MTQLTCNVCRTRECPTGKSLITNEEGTRRNYICTKCIASASSPVIQNTLRIKTLDAPTVLRLRVGGGCSSDCPSGLAGHCSVAQRAAAIEEFGASLG